jgi:phospholipase A1
MLAAGLSVGNSYLSCPAAAAVLLKPRAVVVPWPSVNTRHSPCASRLHSRGAFFAPTALRREAPQWLWAGLLPSYRGLCASASASLARSVKEQLALIFEMTNNNSSLTQGSLGKKLCRLYAANNVWFGHVRLYMQVGAMGILMLGYQSTAIAAGSAPSCESIDDDTARLNCYDQTQGKGDRGGAPPPEQAPPTQGEAADEKASGAPPVSPTLPSLTDVWELDAEHKLGTFMLKPYRANYFLPFRHTDRPNVNPSSPAPDHSVPAPLPLDATEVKFQLSVKFKIWENLLGKDRDLWFGYTQQSNWQLYNTNDSVSSAFRETDYEPEVMLVQRTNGHVLGWDWRMLSLGFVHQSNGQSLPLSRGWNRLYAQFGLERSNFMLLVRPWAILPQPIGLDDNPDIRSYMGSGDVRLTYANAGYVYSVLGRYSFSGGNGALQLDWAFPISGSLKGYVQLFSGYGESLIDYNHSQTVLGIGVLLVPWQ